MSIFRRINSLMSPDKRFEWMRAHDLLRHMSDEAYLRRCFLIKCGYKLNLDNPRTFNEKLQWLKLYDRNPLYTSLVDKYEVKKYVASIIGDEYIIPTIGVYDRFDDIDFDSLPNQFVLKCTHDSGGLVICKDKSKLDIASARKKINGRMNKNYFWLGREYPYKNVKPRIIAETLLRDKMSTALNDYKLMCFNGRVKCSFVCTDRFEPDGLRVTFYDREWKRMPFERHYHASKKDIPKPDQYNEMVELAERLSQGIPFVRVDFYTVNRSIFFGELTFYPGNGFEEFTPMDWDYTLGNWIQLPKR